MSANIDDLRRAWAGGSGSNEDRLKAKFGGSGNIDDLRRAYFGGAAGQNSDDVLRAAYGTSPTANIDDRAAAYYAIVHYIPKANPLISRGLPVVDSGGFGFQYAAANAVDADYSTAWRCVTSPNLQPPATPAPTTAATGGTVAAGVYTVATSYTNASGETIASATGTVTTTGTTSTISVPSPAASGNATGWYAYVSQAGGSTTTRQQAAGSPTAIGTALTLTAPPTSGGLVPQTGTTATNVAQWLDVDVSTVPSAQRTSVAFHWFNDKSLNYWDGVDGANSGNYNTLPRNYTIDASALAGGGSAPAVGDASWVNLVTVTGNTYRDRVHALNLSTYNWVRLKVTLANGPVGNDDVAAQVNIHNTALGTEDAVLFLGDSITSEGMSWGNIGGGAWANGPVTGRIETAKTRYPLYVNGGVPTTTIAYGDTNKATLLNSFPGKYVSVSFGANDASASTTLAAYKTSLLSIIDYLIAQGKTVIVPQITARLVSSTLTRMTPQDDFVVQYNGYIAGTSGLIVDRPAVLIGPDLYTPTLNGTIALRDGLHPTYTASPNGYEAWQTVWAQWLIGNLY